MIGFWIAYIIPLALGFGVGWWLRGQYLIVQATMDEADEWVADNWQPRHMHGEWWDG